MTEEDFSDELAERLERLKRAADVDAAAVSESNDPRFSDGQIKFRQLIDAIQSTLQNMNESSVENPVQKPA